MHIPSRVLSDSPLHIFLIVPSKMYLCNIRAKAISKYLINYKIGCAICISIWISDDTDTDQIAQD